MWSKSKRLHAMKQIHSYYVSNGTVKVKLDENRRPISITHATDFDKHFPGIDLSPPSLMYQSCCIDRVVFNFYDVRMCVSTFWCIYMQKLCFFEILFSDVDPFVYLIVYFVYFSRQNLFVRNRHTPSCHYSHELFLNSHWLGFIVRLVEVKLSI